MQIAVGEATRADLVAAFGPAAATDPAFASVFMPLGETYPFLGAPAQLALQQQQLDRLASPADASAVPPMTPANCPGRGATDPLALARRASVPAAFSQAEAREYRLRMSPLAEQLRQTGVAGSEQEFRDLFNLLGRLETESSPLRQAEVRGELRSRMGNSSFDRFWSMRDPFFAATRTYLEGEGFDARQIQAAHGIIYRYQEKMMATIGRQDPSATNLAALSQVRRDETAELTELLGAAAARGIQVSRNQQAIDAATGLAAPC